MADIDWGGLISSSLRSLGQGYMYGAASYNPSLLPTIIANDPNVQQPAIDNARKNQIGQMIIQGVQAGNIDWNVAQPALQKLGFPVKGMNLGGNNQADALQQYYQGLQGTMAGGPPGLQGSIMRGGVSLPQEAAAVAPGGLVMPPGPIQSPMPGDISAAPGAAQPAPGDLVTAPAPQQDLPPGAPMDRDVPDIVLKRERDPQTGLIIQTNKDPQTGNVYQTRVDPNTGRTVEAQSTVPTTIPGASPEDTAAINQAQATLAQPPVTYAQLYQNLARTGVRLTPKNKQAVESHFKDLVKEDQEKRAAALEQIKTRTELAKMRANDPKKQDRSVAVSINAKGETLYQDQTWNREKGVFEDVGIPHPKGAGVAVNLSPGEKKGQELSAKQVYEKDMPALEGDAALDSQIETMKLLNKDMIGGSFAQERMAINTLASGLGILTKEQEETLSNSRQYGKLLNQLVISYINEKLFPQRVTNVDLQFLAKTTPEQGYSQEARAAILDMLQYYNNYHSKVLQGRIDWYNEHGDISGYKPPKMEPFFKAGPREAAQVPAAPKTMNWEDINK